MVTAGSLVVDFCYVEGNQVYVVGKGFLLPVDGLYAEGRTIEEEKDVT